MTDNGNRLSRMRDLPAHHAHQAEPEQQEGERGDGVLDADDLVINRENITAPEPGLLMVRVGRCVMRHRVRCRVHVVRSLNTAKNRAFPPGSKNWARK